MAKKKKASLKPVNRGFATTSAPSKKAEVVEEDIEDDTAIPNAQGEAGVAHRDSGVTGDTKVGQSNGVHGQTGDWEKDEGEGIYQGYVERLQEKADKEVSRLLKGMEFDRRMNKGFISLSIDRRIRDEMLDLHKATNEEATSEPNPAPSPPTGPAREKLLTKLYVTQKILTESGFSQEAVREYLSRPSSYAPAGEEETWEGALGHMWLMDEPGKVKAM